MRRRRTALPAQAGFPDEDGGGATYWALRARDGDVAAMAAFVRASQHDVWRFCAYLLDRESADDLAQETFLRAFRTLPSFRGDASAVTWLFTIARRVVAEELNRRCRHGQLIERLAPRVQAEMADPAGHVDLQSVISLLPPDRRLAFMLTQVFGLSYGEAAGICGCPVGTIRSRVARARTDLMAALDTTLPVKPRGIGGRSG
jgi:RNA polymerase sigma-70 factor (ECF subfamily)